MVAQTCIINHGHAMCPGYIRLHLVFPCFGNSLHSHRIVTKHLFLDLTCFKPLLVFEMAKQVELSSIRCVGKGNHECRFKKGGEHENAFKVTNDRGQLGHLQMELFGPLWPLHGKMTV